MSNILIEAEEAYKKFLKSSRNILGLNLKKRENLKSFSRVQKEENAFNSVYLGIKEVPLAKIVGSVEKFEDFDNNFVPKNNIVKERWKNIYRAYMNDEMLPTVHLYKIKDSYYVYDGNHRVSVAKYLNFASIEAEVEEFLPTNDKMEEVVYRENMLFEKETGLKDILFSDPIRYKYLKREIDSYCSKYGKNPKDWSRNIFEPVINIFVNNDIMNEYPEKNINDIFYYYLEHKKYLNKISDEKIGYLYSVIYFVSLVKTKKDLNLDRICEIEEDRDSFEKLRKTDSLESGNSEADRRKKEKSEEIERIFQEKMLKLPQKYRDSWVELAEEGKISEYIIKYSELKSRGDKDSIENTVLNYIIEIFIPIAEEIGGERKFCGKYEKIQEQYFYLIEMEEDFSLEGKAGTFERIAGKHSFFQNDIWNIDIKKIVLKEKEEEFLKNLRNGKEFLEIFEKYGSIEIYKTYVKLFEWLDIFDEDRLAEKLKNGLEKVRNSDELIRYKTEKVLLRLQENTDIGFIDFYVKNEDKHEEKEQKKLKI